MWLQLAFPTEDLIIRAVTEIMTQSIGGLNISTNFGVLWIIEGGAWLEEVSFQGCLWRSVLALPFLSAPLCFLTTTRCTASSSRPFFWEVLPCHEPTLNGVSQVRTLNWPTMTQNWPFIQTLKLSLSSVCHTHKNMTNAVSPLLRQCLRSVLRSHVSSCPWTCSSFVVLFSFQVSSKSLSNHVHGFLPDACLLPKNYFRIFVLFADFFFRQLIVMLGTETLLQFGGR